MIDAHVHIEAGPYNKEWIYQFIRAAINRNIDRLYLLEHSFRFEEFRGIYEEVFEHSECGAFQKRWFDRRCCQSVYDYQRLIDAMRKERPPIEIKFGLEMCYFPKQEKRTKKLLSDSNYDFVTGSIHWIDGWGFDQPKTRYLWETQNINKVYSRYYQVMIQLVESALFTILGHPDSIKCMQYQPNGHFTDQYELLSQALNRRNMAAEYSSGLRLNYGHHELGLNQELLRIFLRDKVKLVTASDAHRPADVGKYIEESYQTLGWAHQ